MPIIAQNIALKGSSVLKWEGNPLQAWIEIGMNSKIEANKYTINIVQLVFLNLGRYDIIHANDHAFNPKAKPKTKVQDG